MAVTRAIVAVLCVLFVCPEALLSPPPPFVSLRHVRNAAEDVGDERKEGGEGKDRNEERAVQGSMARVFLSAHYLLSV